MMGLSPRDIDRLTLSEFHAMFDGFAAMHGAKPDDDDLPSAEEFYRVMSNEIAAGRV